MQWESDALAVELDPHLPIVRSYRHLPTGIDLGGASSDGQFVVNGLAVPWERWRIRVAHGMRQATYALDLVGERIGFDLVFTLDGATLRIEMRRLRDPQRRFQSLAFHHLPLLSVQDPSFSWWRFTTSHDGWPQDRTVHPRGLWWGYRVESGMAGAAGDASTPALYACLRRPGQLCAFVHSNYPLFPLTQAGGALGLGAWRYRVRNKTLPPLVAEVVFLPDGEVDAYLRWVNARLPDADPDLRGALWYKIFLDSPSTGVRTTLPQAQEILRRLYHVTDGLPQIAYLVGWQYDGHDTGYPSLDRVNEKLGGLPALQALAKIAREQYRTNLSFHANIDDAYADSKDFDPQSMARDFDGAPMFWFEEKGRICYHLSHTKDVESGARWRRLQAMKDLLPWRRTVQLDALRTTNCNPEWEPERLDVLEELECGVRPTVAWLRRRGMNITTEGINGMPHEVAGLVSGFWHLGDWPELLPLWHRKLIGGGIGEGRGRRECCLGTSIHQDFTWEPTQWSLQASDQWEILVERIYLGTLLYHFYLERELLSFEGGAEGGLHFRYADGVEARWTPDDHLRVTWRDMVIADDDDRFIPRGQALYAYSRSGSARRWLLPPALRGRRLNLSALSADGRGPAPEHHVDGDTIWLTLPARTPVKIEPLE